MNSYSFSSLSRFESCPRAFEYQYVKKVPEAFYTIEQHLGHAVHESLEKAYRDKVDGEPWSRARIIEQFNVFWSTGALEKARIVKKGRKAGDYYEEGISMVISYHERIFQADAGETLNLELRFSLELPEVGVGPRSYSGVIDRISREKNGTLRITDYKTGKSVPSPAEDLQLRSYALHVLSKNDAPAVELCYEDLRAGRSLSCIFPRNESAGVRQRIVRQIESIEGTTEYPATPSILCGWCGFNEICPFAMRSRYTRNGW